MSTAYKGAYMHPRTYVVTLSAIALWKPDMSAQVDVQDEICLHSDEREQQEIAISKIKDLRSFISKDFRVVEHESIYHRPSKLLSAHNKVPIKVERSGELPSGNAWSISPTLPMQPCMLCSGLLTCKVPRERA